MSRVARLAQTILWKKPVVYGYFAVTAKWVEAMALRLRHLAWLPYWQGTDCALPSLLVIGTTVLGSGAAIATSRARTRLRRRSVPPALELASEVR